MRFFERRPYLLSLAMLILVVVWMLVPMADEKPAQDAVVNRAERVQRVQVAQPAQETLHLSLSFTGQTRPNVSANISAELDALLAQIYQRRGAFVEKGDLLVSLSTGSLETALLSARAERSRAQLAYETESTLAKQGVTTPQTKAAAYATLQASRAQVDQLQKEIEKSRIVAPFSGVLADRFVEQGDFVSVGQPVLLLISVDPLIAVGGVSERDVNALKNGDKATVRIKGQEPLDGVVTYISPVADEATRTFDVEVTFPNERMEVPVGMTTQIVVSVDTVLAHKLSPALLTLDAAGNIQVATVDDSDTVRLQTVSILHSEASGVWVDGVPEGARIITRGQGFVREGEIVNPAMVQPESVFSAGHSLGNSAGSRL